MIGEVQDAIERDEDHAGELVAMPVPGRFPRYPLGLAFPAGSERWREILAAALEEELFGASILATARLWADLLRTASREGARRRAWRASPFPLASREFQVELCTRLLRGLSEDMPDAADGPADRAVLERALKTIPEAWGGVLFDIALGETPGSSAAVEMLSAAPRHCHSCGTSLREARGASDDFCRYCTDEQGRLLPRDEVHGILADWFRTWKPDLTRSEATSRAERLMDAMPAWSPN